MPTSTPAWSNVSLAASTFGSMWLDIPRPEYPTADRFDHLRPAGGRRGLHRAVDRIACRPAQSGSPHRPDRGRTGSAGRRRAATAASSTPASPTAWRTESRAGPTRSTRSRRWAGRTSTACRPISSRLGLDVEWQRTGMLSVATEPHQVDWLRRRRRRRRGPAARPARGPRRGSLADLSGGPVQPRHLCDRASGQARVRTGPRLPGSRRAHLRAHQRTAPGLRRRRAAHPLPARRPSPPQRRAGDERLSRACCGATGCTPCRCTTTCWPPSHSPTRSSTASAGGAGRESATAPTNFTTTG